jgi:hypothetical protein
MAENSEPEKKDYPPPPQVNGVSKSQKETSDAWSGISDLANLILLGVVVLCGASTLGFMGACLSKASDGKEGDAAFLGLVGAAFLYVVVQALRALKENRIGSVRKGNSGSDGSTENDS